MKTTYAKIVLVIATSVFLQLNARAVFIPNLKSSKMVSAYRNVLAARMLNMTYYCWLLITISRLVILIALQHLISLI
jgi:hypothetical protein